MPAPSKPIQQMTDTELRERQLQLRVAEAECWQQQANVRQEQAAVDLEIYNRETRR